jgi:hypothetical protein
VDDGDGAQRGTVVVDLEGKILGEVAAAGVAVVETVKGRVAAVDYLVDVAVLA